MGLSSFVLLCCHAIYGCIHTFREVYHVGKGLWLNGKASVWHANEPRFNIQLKYQVKGDGKDP